ncbi:MAG TPA: antibiotic biosynthesis monooxygenase [Mucilaginibacter sp.]|jgi:quinol monooxygenase YgiN|nr:antibiotic biosynthesis monooxygenase [Mucilaginibacter sp.]
MKNFSKIKNSFRRIVLVTTAMLLLQISAIAQQAESGQVQAAKPLVLSIKFKTTPENAGKFKDVLIHLFDTISHEKNFVSANLHEAIGKPGEFLVYEIWNDNIEHFLSVQMKSPYAVQFEKTLKNMNVERDPAAYTSFGHWVKK